VADYTASVLGTHIQLTPGLCFIVQEKNLMCSKHSLKLMEDGIGIVHQCLQYLCIGYFTDNVKEKNFMKSSMAMYFISEHVFFHYQCIKLIEIRIPCLLR